MGLFRKKAVGAPAAVPAHVAFIMDGNGRWARRRGLPRKAGHAAGAEACRRIFRYCKKIGIRTVTVYAFSTENWSRPKDEVDALMKLFDKYVDTLLAEYRQHGVRFVFIGDKSPLSPELREKMERLERESAALFDDYTLNIAINYGGRDEIVHAVNSLFTEGKTAVTQEDIASHLYTAHSPDPDLIVRTAGERRLSNFLLWQASYSELYSTQTLWPDMKERDVDEALHSYAGRVRRFGGVK